MSTVGLLAIWCSAIALALLGGILSSSGSLLALGVIVTATVFPMLLVRPALSIALLFPIVAILPPAPDSMGIYEMGYTVAFGAAMLSWLIWATVHRKPPPLRGSLLTILVLLFCMVGSFFTARVYFTPMDEWIRGLTPFLNLLIIFPAYYAFRSSNDRLVLLAGVYTGGLIVAIQTVILGSRGLATAVETGNALFIRGSLEGGSYQAIFIGPAAFSLGALILGGRRRWLHGVIFILLWGAISLTLLRSLIIILVALLLLAAILYVKESFNLISLIRGFITVVAGAVAAGSVLSQRGHLVVDIIVSGFLERAAFGNTVQRFSEYEAVWRVARDNLITGHGLGFEYSYYRPGYGMRHDTYTHNLFSYMLLTLGIGGVLLIAMLAWFLAKDAVLALTYKADDRDVITGILFTLAAVSIYVMFQSVFRTISFSLIIGVFGGVLLSLRHEVEALQRQSSEKSNDPLMKASSGGNNASVQQAV